LIEHFLGSPLQQNMDADECDRLCERLRDCVSLGPGVHNALFALPEILVIIATLRTTAPGKDVVRSLDRIEIELKDWFSPEKWRGHDRGVSFQQDLYSDIWCLKLGMQLLSAQTNERHRSPNRPPHAPS
jgi:hypothetical protein